MQDNTERNANNSAGGDRTIWSPQKTRLQPFDWGLHGKLALVLVHRSHGSESPVSMPECEGALADSMADRPQQLRLQLMTAFDAVQVEGALRTAADHTPTCCRS